MPSSSHLRSRSCLTASDHRELKIYPYKTSEPPATAGGLLQPVIVSKADVTTDPACEGIAIAPVLPENQVTNERLRNPDCSSFPGQRTRTIRRRPRPRV